MAVNKTVYQGRLTKQPELKTTQSGINHMDFTLAWNKKYKEQEKKCFLPCKAWRYDAEFINRTFCKGQEMVVVGELGTEEWTDNDGNKRSRIVLNVEEVNFAGDKKQDTGAAQTAANAPAPATSAPAGGGFVEVPDSELPF